MAKKPVRPGRGRGLAGLFELPDVFDRNRGARGVAFSIDTRGERAGRDGALGRVVEESVFAGGAGSWGGQSADRAGVVP